MQAIALFLSLLLLAPFEVQTEWDKSQPLYGGCKYQHYWEYDYTCHYDETTHVWTDRTALVDNWVRASGPDELNKLTEKLTFHVPVKKRYVLVVSQKLYRHPEHYVAMVAALPASSRRFVGINVEAGIWPEESRIWPHLGMLYVGTVAKQEGYEVILWDELIQGPAPLEKLVQPGDVVGLSLLTTGIDRGVDVAATAKELGARQVIAGNDSAMFRAAELLARSKGFVDAVFTSNSIPSMRQYFRKGGATSIANVLVKGGSAPFISNESRAVALERRAFGAEDFFLVPDLGLFGPEYWNLVWSAYRNQFGHKHADSSNIRNAIALFGQGCGRAGMGDICEYCSIRHVANVLIPTEAYLEQTLDAYKSFGINTFFNTTDSAFEMSKLADRLVSVGSVDSLVIYGRAQAMAQRPDLFDKWLRFANQRLLINCGMDSADERILQLGINKSGSKSGSRLEENRQAIRNIKAAGPNAHLHFSLIFGSPGETEDSCKANLDFLQWAIDTLGEQLDVVEGDIFWLNFGAPASSVFTSYDEAVRRAALAGKAISKEEWYRDFAQYATELSVPEQSEKAWYRHFTSIDYETALAYNEQVRKMVANVPGNITGREFAFKPPKDLT